MSALIPISRRLARDTARLRFAPPVACVYRPLLYAREPHERYLARWGDGPRELLFLGMNPGPYGMMQTGVPFGEVAAVQRVGFLLAGTMVARQDQSPTNRNPQGDA